MSELNSGKCPVCGAPLTDHVCDYCGYTVPQEFSENGTAQPVIQQTVVVQQNINVNHKQNVPVRYVSEKSRTITLIICFLFGLFGGHYFYIGKIRRGFLYLFTGGLLGVGWIIDFFKIIFGSFKDKYGLPIKEW